MTEMENSMSLLQLNTIIAGLIMSETTRNVWITAELSDVQVRGGHCYMELIEKDGAGRQVAKARGIIWASSYPAIAGTFYQATGRHFASGIKVMLRVTASMHPVFGLSLQVTAVNPEYTMGDLMRRRRETLLRLKADGVLELNRQLEWAKPTRRVAVVSSEGAAGFGDFRRHLYENPYSLRFVTSLFPAIVQGERAPQSIIAALDCIAAQIDDWDCVVIIRGGGATSDLQAFEDYELASTVAQFPIPVISGVGHDRDITVLDYVANANVKTPTAAADLIIHFEYELLNALQTLGNAILSAAGERISGAREQLSYIEGLIPLAPVALLGRAETRLRAALMSLGNVSSRRIIPSLERLRMIGESLAPTLQTALRRSAERLDNSDRLLAALSPQAVLARGYSITRDADGHAVTDASRLTPGQTVVTTLARGSIASTVVDAGK